MFMYFFDYSCVNLKIFWQEKSFSCEINSSAWSKNRAIYISTDTSSEKKFHFNILSLLRLVQVYKLH